MLVMILTIIIIILAAGGRWCLSRNWVFLVPTLHLLHLPFTPVIDVAMNFTQVRPNNSSSQLHRILRYFPDILA